MTDSDARYGCTRYGLFALCNAIESRVIDIDIDIRTKLTNIVVIITSDPIAYFDGSIGFIAVPDQSGITVALPEIVSRQYGVSRPPPSFGLDKMGDCIMDLNKIVGRSPLAFLNKTNWTIRVVDFTFDGRNGFIDCDKPMVYFTDQIVEPQCIKNTAGWLTTKNAHANRCSTERFVMNPNQGLPGIIIGADDQTVQRTLRDNSNVFTNQQLQNSQGWTPWFKSNPTQIKSKGAKRYETLRTGLEGLNKLGEVNERCTFARHPIELNDRYRDFVIAAVSGDRGLDVERWGWDKTLHDGPSQFRLQACQCFEA